MYIIFILLLFSKLNLTDLYWAVPLMVVWDFAERVCLKPCPFRDKLSLLFEYDIEPLPCTTISIKLIYNLVIIHWPMFYSSYIHTHHDNLCRWNQSRLIVVFQNNYQLNIYSFHKSNALLCFQFFFHCLDNVRVGFVMHNFMVVYNFKALAIS